MAVWQSLRRVSLTHWILFSMVAGVLIGWRFPGEAQELKVISTVFLKLIKCILVPLVFSTLVVGVAGHADDLKAVGRLALKSIFYFEVITTFALAIGLLAVAGLSGYIPAFRASRINPTVALRAN